MQVDAYTGNIYFLVSYVEQNNVPAVVKFLANGHLDASYGTHGLLVLPVADPGATRAATSAGQVNQLEYIAAPAFIQNGKMSFFTLLTTPSTQVTQYKQICLF